MYNPFPKYRHKPRREPTLTGAAALCPVVAVTSSTIKYKSKVAASCFLQEVGLQESINSRASELFSSLYIDPRQYAEEDLPKIKRACSLCGYMVEDDTSMRNSKGFTISW